MSSPTDESTTDQSAADRTAARSTATFTDLVTGTRGDLPGWLCVQEDRELRGGVVVVHGLGEHADRHRETARVFAEAGFATLAYDQQGHGQAPGRRGAPRSYDSMLDDMDAARSALRESIGDLPQMLFGHSMGGNLAASYTLRWPHDLAGLILSGPLLLPAQPPNRNQIFAAWLTGRILPFIRISAGIEPDQLTQDPEELRALAEDPLMHSKMSLHLATQLLAQGRWALDHAPEIRIPLLVLHGGEDALTDAAASHALCLRVGEHAEYHEMPGMRHEVLHETEREKAFAIIRDWLDNQPTGTITGQSAG